MKEYDKLRELMFKDRQTYIDEQGDYWAVGDMENYTGAVKGIAIDKLADLENKIENGTLIELPCKVGDTVYIACDWDIKEVVKGVVSEIEYTVNAGGYYYRIYVDHEYIFSKTNPNIIKNRYIFAPKELFKAREEAEKRLKELQE